MHHIKRVYPSTVTNIISLMTDQVIHQKFNGIPSSGDIPKNIFIDNINGQNIHAESEAYSGKGHPGVRY